MPVIKRLAKRIERLEGRRGAKGSTAEKRDIERYRKEIGVFLQGIQARHESGEASRIMDRMFERLEQKADATASDATVAGELRKRLAREILPKLYAETMAEIKKDEKDGRTPRETSKQVAPRATEAPLQRVKPIDWPPGSGSGFHD